MKVFIALVFAAACLTASAQSDIAVNGNLNVTDDPNTPETEGNLSVQKNIAAGEDIKAKTFTVEPQYSYYGTNTVISESKFEMKEFSPYPSGNERMIKLWLNGFAIGTSQNFPSTSGIAIGSGNSGLGHYSIDVGITNKSYARYSVILGEGNSAGYGTSKTAVSVLLGGKSNSMRDNTSNSLVFGMENTFGGDTVFSLGAKNESSGKTFSAGFNLVNDVPYQTVLGRFNDQNVKVSNGGEWEGEDPLFVVGNGISDEARSNALVIRKNGDIEAGGTLHVGSVKVKKPAGGISMGDFGSSEEE